MSHLDRVRDRVPIEGGHGTRSRTDGSTVSGTRWDTVGHSHESIQEELSQRLAETLEATKTKLAAEKQDRQEKTRNRNLGLKSRYQKKEKVLMTTATRIAPLKPGAIADPALNVRALAIGYIRTYPQFDARELARVMAEDLHDNHRELYREWLDQVAPEAAFNLMMAARNNLDTNSTSRRTR